MQTEIYRFLSNPTWTEEKITLDPEDIQEKGLHSNSSGKAVISFSSNCSQIFLLFYEMISADIISRLARCPCVAA